MPMLVATIVSCAWILVAAQDPAVGAAADAKLVQKITAEAESTIRNGPVAGIAVGVLRAGATLFCGGFGFADLENEVPVTERTFFRLGSVTKQFTAAALLQQVEDGKLALDDRLSRHLPQVRAPGGDPTLLQLLNHTSGIKSFTSLPDFRLRAYPSRPDRVVRSAGPADARRADDANQWRDSVRRRNDADAGPPPERRREACWDRLSRAPPSRPCRTS
jgi:CubicO group peptidase (beta-lactamase class C family)